MFYAKLFCLLPDYSLKLKSWDTVKKKEPQEGASSLFRVSSSLVSWQRTTDKHERMPPSDDSKQSFLIPHELSKNSLFDPEKKNNSEERSSFSCAQKYVSPLWSLLYCLS